MAKASVVAAQAELAREKVMEAIEGRVSEERMSNLRNIGNMAVPRRPDHLAAQQMELHGCWAEIVMDLLDRVEKLEKAQPKSSAKGAARAKKS